MYTTITQTAEKAEISLYLMYLLTVTSGAGLVLSRTGFDIHEQDNRPTLSNKPEKFHDVRTAEGTPRAHLLTSETF